MLNVANLEKLIAHLEAQPPETFNMGNTEFEGCGTAACIGGHICALFGMNWMEACDALGTDDKLSKLYVPQGWMHESRAERQRYPLPRAIATLKRLRDHYLATGEIVVDWGPEPGDEPAQPCAAPRATELTPPELPASLTRLLSAPSDTSESAGVAGEAGR